MLDGMRRHASSWIIKILFAVIIIVFIFAFGMGGFQGDRAQVLAYVNDQAIMIQDFERLYERRVRNLRDQNPNISHEDLAKAQFKRQVFDTMVNTNLLLAEAQRLGLGVSNAELIGYIQDVPVFQNEQNQFDKTRYERVLSDQRMSPGDYESDVSRSILLDKLRQTLDLAVSPTEAEARDLFAYAKEQVVVDYVLYAWKDFAASVKPSDQEIADWFEANKERFRRPPLADFALLPVTPASLAKPAEIADAEAAEYYKVHLDEFRQPAQAKARHILIKVDQNAPADAVEKARKETLDIRARVLKGESFSDLARELSQGPSSVKGGDLGWFPKGAMVGPFDEAAFSLPLNTVSAPVRTQFGWHLVLVEERRPGGLRSLEEASSDIKRTLAEERATTRLQDALDQALEQAVTGDALQRIGQDIGVQITRTGLVSSDQLAARLGLDQETAGRIFDLTLGQVTDTPISIPDGYMLAAKTEVKASEVPPLDNVRAAGPGQSGAREGHGAGQGKGPFGAREPARAGHGGVRRPGAGPGAARQRAHRAARFRPGPGHEPDPGGDGLCRAHGPVAGRGLPRVRRLCAGPSGQAHRAHGRGMGLREGILDHESASFRAGRHVPVLLDPVAGQGRVPAGHAPVAGAVVPVIDARLHGDQEAGRRKPSGLFCGRVTDVACACTRRGIVEKASLFNP